MRFCPNATLACLCGFALALAGCGDDDSSATPDAHTSTKDAGRDGSDGESADGSAAEDAATPADAGTAQVSLAGRIIDYTTQDPIAGASVCLTIPHSSDPPCTKTSDSGDYSIDIPADEDVAVTVHADGYPDAIMAEHLTSDMTTDLSPVTKANLKMVASAAGVTIDDARGHLALNVAAASATFSIEPASGTLLYFDASGAPSTTEKATTTAHLAVLFNAAAGTYEATYDVGDRQCQVTLGWPGKHANSVRAPVVAGAITSVGMGCL